jgi:hypothetical protein
MDTRHRSVRPGPHAQPTGSRSRSVRLMLASSCLALAAGGLTSCGLIGGDDRSEEAFCNELHTGNDKMRENSESANDDALGQFGSVFANMGEYTTLLHRLDEVAPDAIKIEMHDSRVAWEKQAENVPHGTGIGDLAGGLAFGLMLAMTSSASMKTVDDYAQEHCDMRLFSMG